MERTFATSNPIGIKLTKGTGEKQDFRKVFIEPATIFQSTSAHVDVTFFGRHDPDHTG